MADFDKINVDGNVEDRRGASLGPIAGISTVGIIMVLGFVMLTGGNLEDALKAVTDVTSQAPQSSQQPGTFEDTKKYKEFATKVLGSTNFVWEQQFKKEGYKYVPPKLVLFRNNTDSGCGGADSRVGPHYCPTDKTIYLDETFFEELTNKFGAKGGQVAEGYVIAHEVGHHVQHITGVFGQLNVQDNAQSVLAELQADCYAGVWAKVIEDQGIINASEIDQAIDAASSVGDDRIQKKATGRVNPETWTHGSSVQRKGSFIKGFNTGDNNSCNLE